MPLVNFLSHKDEFPVGDSMRNLSFMIGHVGFFMFNFLNCVFLLLISGFVFKRLWGNTLSKLGLMAALIQCSGSCTSSIHRYNIDDEFGFYAHTGVWFGILAYFPFNICMLHLLFNANKGEIGNISYITIGTFIWLAITVWCIVASEMYWDELNFAPFQYFVALSTIIQTTAYSSLLYSQSKGMVGFSAGGDFSVSSQSVTRLALVAIGLQLVAFAGAGSGIPVFIYPATGLTFTIMCITSVVFGEMDFMQDHPVIGGDSIPVNEGSSLL